MVTTMPRKKRPAPDGGGAGGEAEEGISSVRAVDRAVAILRSFTVDAPAMSVLEIQRRVGLSRPTLYRLLQTLCASGMIESEGDPQRFRLASGVMQLAHTWLSGLSIVDAGRPIIDRLREESDETVALFVLRGADRLCVLEQKSRHFLAISRGVGFAGPITVGASGKAILAFMTEAERETVLAQAEAADRKDLKAVIEGIRARGYAVSRGEVFVGAVALAAPVFDHSGDVVGSIGIFGPSARVPEAMIEGLATMVVAAADALSAQLGHRGRAEPAAPVPRRRKAG
jgi:DNA-binding IclR family transcriptional regulator